MGILLMINSGNDNSETRCSTTGGRQWINKRLLQSEFFHFIVPSALKCLLSILSICSGARRSGLLTSTPQNVSSTSQIKCSLIIKREGKRGRQERFKINIATTLNNFMKVFCFERQGQGLEGGKMDWMTKCAKELERCAKIRCAARHI